MARIIHTHELSPGDLANQWERDQVYNGLDTCVTYEVLEQLLPQLDEHTSATYDLSRGLQAPTLEMRLRGVKVDLARRAEVIEEYHEQLDQLERQLDEIVLEGVGMPGFNWRSNADLQALFYGKLQSPPILSGGRPTVNRKALEKLDAYLVARPIVRHLLAMRDIGKRIGVLQTAIDPDGRMRTSYNIAGTSTGRFSSSFTEFGTGGNLQNVEESLRSIFVSDPGTKFAKFDAKSGESFCVGAIEWNLFGDDRYLSACESGDPHTAVARLVWPGLPWTGDLKSDKEIAEQKFYRHLSHRDVCKRLGHGSNYLGRPGTLAEQSSVPIELVRQFQPKYFKSFPAHLRWHEWLDIQLRRHGWLISLTGRKRYFFGRRNDDETKRGAVAYDPQCSLADIVNRAMLRLWRTGLYTIVLHDHDALTFQYPEEQEDEIIPVLLSELVEPIPLRNGRVLRIPYDCQVGWNRGKCSEQNPDGLIDYKGPDKRKRTTPVPLLDRVVRRTHR